MLGDVQFLEGYTVLLPDPVVRDLTVSDEAQRKTYL